MTLWRVDVSGVSHRFVEAESQDEAEALVLASLLEALDLRATPADKAIAEAYEAASSRRRRYMLARLDGLTNPAERQSATSAMRRLERLAEMHRQEQAWIREQVAKAPPVSPEVADKLTRLLEISDIEKSFERLPNWNRHDSPIHGE